MPPKCHVDVASISGEGKGGAAAHEKYQTGKTRSRLVKRGELVMGWWLQDSSRQHVEAGSKKREPSLSEGICLGKESLKHMVRRGKAKKKQEEKSREGDGGKTRQEAGCSTGRGQSERSSS